MTTSTGPFGSTRGTEVLLQPTKIKTAASVTRQTILEFIRPNTRAIAHPRQIRSAATHRRFESAEMSAPSKAKAVRLGRNFLTPKSKSRKTKATASTETRRSEHKSSHVDLIFRISRFRGGLQNAERQRIQRCYYHSRRA